MEWLKMRGRLASGWSRYFLVLLASLLVSVFAVVITNTTSVNAADVVWEGSSLKKGNDTYSPYTNSDVIKSMGIPDGSQVYTTPFNINVSHNSVKVLYFPSNSPPSSATSVRYLELDFTPPDNWRQISSSTDTIDQTTNTQSTSESTSCNISGIGWFICGPSMWIAEGMDWIYSGLSEFMEVRPLEISNSSSSFYQAWNILRNIANVAFIIAFLIIVYSQVTSFGVSSYGIKKLTPRLIIAALLVNLSYVICAILIDLSNIAGFAVNDMFMEITRQLTVDSSSNNAGMFSFSDNMQTFLAGGTLLLAGGAVTGASLLAATPVVVPLFATLFLALLVALAVMAARQALIIILTIIAPLAFVCYLLPGTEKWFEKWRNTFFTMLIFFPAFGFVFGGSQLAGILITSNASSLIIFILGIAVQLAPLAITPLILRLGGGVLNRFAGIINDPSKGLVDRSKNWANEKRAQIANERTYGNDKLGRRHVLRRAARAWNYMGRRHKERVENYQKKADAAYAATEGHAALDRQRREIEHDQKIIDSALENRWNEHLLKDGRAIEKELKLRISVDKTELNKLKLDNRYAEMKTGHLPTIQRPDGTTSALDTASIRSMRNSSQFTAQHLAAQGLRKSTADRELNKQIAEQMLIDKDLLAGAAGVYGEIGQDNALASAVSTMRSEAGKSIESSAQLMKHFKLNAKQRQDLLKGTAITAIDSSGASYTFKPTNSFAVEAAIEEQMAVGTVGQVSEILSMSGSGGKLSEYRGSISDALAKSGIKGKAPFLGGKLIDDVYKGEIKNMSDLQQYVVEWVAGGKFKPSDISITDKEGLELLTKSINQPGARSTIGTERLKGLREKIDAVYDNKELLSNVADNATKPLADLRNSLP